MEGCPLSLQIVGFLQNPIHRHKVFEVASHYKEIVGAMSAASVETIPFPNIPINRFDNTQRVNLKSIQTSLTICLLHNKQLQ